MKNNFKRILAFVLGFLMFLFPAPRASAQIEVVEFSDESRLIRFTKSDLQNMVDWYHSVAASYIAKGMPITLPTDGYVCCADDPGLYCDRDCANRGQWLGGFFVFLGVGFFGCGFIYTEETALMLSMFLSGIVLLAVGVTCCVCHCRAKERLDEITRVSAKPGESWLGPVDILATMIRQNVAVGADESQPLLRGGMQGAPGYFLLFVRSKAKSEFDPKPFFTTDRDTNLAQSLRNNRFAGLIRDVGGKLRARGARITKRYYLSKVGSGFEETSDPRVMHEIDSVDVVVDGADSDEVPYL